MKYTNRLLNVAIFSVLVTTCFLEKSVLATDLTLQPSESAISQARTIAEGARPNRDEIYFGTNGTKDFLFKRFFIRGDGACGPSALGFKSRDMTIKSLLKNANSDSFRLRVWQEIYDEWEKLPEQMQSSNSYKSAKTVVQKRNYAKSESAYRDYVNHRLSDDDWYFLCQSGRGYFLDGLAYLQKLNLCVWSSRSDYPFQLTFVNGTSSNAIFKTRHMHLKGLHYSRLVEEDSSEEMKQAQTDEDFQVNKLFYHLLANSSQDVPLKKTSFSGGWKNVSKPKLMKRSKSKVSKKYDEDRKLNQALSLSKNLASGSRALKTYLPKPKGWSGKNKFFKIAGERGIGVEGVGFNIKSYLISGTKLSGKVITLSADVLAYPDSSKARLQIYNPQAKANKYSKYHSRTGTFEGLWVKYTVPENTDCQKIVFRFLQGAKGKDKGKYAQFKIDKPTLTVDGNPKNLLKNPTFGL